MLQLPLPNAIKKYSIALLIFSSMNTAAAETNWSKVIETAPRSPQVLLQLDPYGQILAKAMQMPNGQFRLVYFYSFKPFLKPRIYIDNYQGPDSIATICRASLRDGKPFKGKLKFTVDAWVHNAASLEIVPIINYPRKKIGQVSNVVFENPFVLGPVNVDFDVTKVVYSTIPGRPKNEFQSNADILNYYRDLLKTEAMKPNQVQASIDLSDKNGFACDLMLKNLSIKVSQQASYETGAPTKTEWIGNVDYLNMFKIYWKTEPFYFKDATSVSDEDRAFVLGYKSSYSFTQLQESKPSRVTSLIKSLSLNIDALKTRQIDEWSYNDIENNVVMASEYSMPKVLSKDEELILLDQYDGIAIRPTSEEM